MEPTSSTKICLCPEGHVAAASEDFLKAIFFADHLSFERVHDISRIKLATNLIGRKFYIQAYEAADKIVEAVKSIPIYESILLGMVKEKDFKKIYPITQRMAQRMASKEADSSLASVADAVSEAAEFALALQIIMLISDPYDKLKALAKLATRLFDNGKLREVGKVNDEFLNVLTCPLIDKHRLQKEPICSHVKQGIRCFAAANEILENKKFPLHSSFSWDEYDERDILRKTCSYRFRQNEFSAAFKIIDAAQIFKLQFYVDGAEIVIQKKNWDKFDEIMQKIKALPDYPFKDTKPNPFMTIALSLAQAGEKEKAESLILAEIGETDRAEALASLGRTIVEKDPDFACSLVQRILSLSCHSTDPYTKYAFGVKLIKAGKVQVAKEFFEKSSPIGNPYAGSFDSFVIALLEANEDEYVAKMKVPEDFNFEGIVIGLVNKKLILKALQVAKCERNQEKKSTELLLVLSEMIKAGFLDKAIQEVDLLARNSGPVQYIAVKALILIGRELVIDGKFREVKDLVDSYFKEQCRKIIYMKIAFEALTTGHFHKLVQFCNYIPPSILSEFEKAAALAFQEKKLTSDVIMENIPLMMIGGEASEAGITEGLSAMTLDSSTIPQYLS